MRRLRSTPREKIMRAYQVTRKRRLGSQPPIIVKGTEVRPVLRTDQGQPIEFGFNLHQIANSQNTNSTETKTSR